MAGMRKLLLPALLVAACGGPDAMDSPDAAPPDAGVDAPPPPMPHPWSLERATAPAGGASLVITPSGKRVVVAEPDEGDVVVYTRDVGGSWSEGQPLTGSAMEHGYTLFEPSPSCAVLIRWSFDGPVRLWRLTDAGVGADGALTVR